MIMLNEKFKEALKIIAQKLNNAKINWALIASTNLTLQEMELEPNDIDILIPFSEGQKVEKIFDNYKRLSNQKPSNDEHEKMNFLINGVEVEFCCEYEHGFYSQFLNKAGTFYKNLDSTEISCLKLENEIRAYEHYDRVERAEMVKDFIKNQNASN